MTDFKYLFTPMSVGHLEVKNRICCSGHADALAVDGLPQEVERRYYEEKARGGVGFMMCFGSASVHPTSTARDWNGVELFDDRVIPHLRLFSEAMHRYDVPVVSQITHRGRRGRSVDLWNRLYAPSDVREPNHRENPHPVSEGMLDEFVEAFASAAGRLKEGGFDGCEVMASHCHLIDQFWTRNVNRRGDLYGGGIENRLRFGRRVIDAIRNRVGRDFIVGIRVTGDDFTERGLDNETMLEICSHLDADGQLDYFNVIGGSAETYVGESAAVPNMAYELGCYTHLSASIRQVVDVPVIATGRIVDPVQADKIIAEGQADLCIMNRALIADPHMPNKARSSQVEEIRQCMGYNEGCIDRIYTGRGVTCVQNPVIGREKDWAELGRARDLRRVVVVGGGPAGLESARVAAERGHTVVVFEKDEELGGQTRIARRAPKRGDFDGAIRWSSAQCQKLGVQFRMGCEATVESVLAEAPDVVIVATGADSRIPEIENLSEADSCSAWDVLSGSYELGDVVLVIDEEYGHQGPSVAEYLLQDGKEVDILTSQETLANFLGATVRPPILTRLFRQGVQIFTHMEAQRIEERNLIARNIWSGELFEIGPYDGFVHAYGGIRRDVLSEEIQAAGVECRVVGDAFSPRSLQHAILEGHAEAREI
ncbi:MAG: FAD-dependent oxidoreductase [Myxococcota bacterium]|nr:FAD-dependent oxidoreductase [Myxococcota bacterium]